MISIIRDYFAYLDDMDIITILLPFSYHEGNSSSFYLIDDKEQKYPLIVKEKLAIDGSMKYISTTNTSLEFGQLYWVCDEHGGKTDLQIGAVIRTRKFDDLFYYDGRDLGVTLDGEETRFKLWAPTATEVKVKLTTATGKTEIFLMNRQEKGVWSLVKKQRLEGYKYTFLVCVNLRWQEAVDPYATSVSANGKEGVVIDLEKTRAPKPLLPHFEHPVDAIIYEAHIRDFTIHPKSGVQNKGKYLGASELNTSNQGVGLTGLNYLKDLGVTHIEFLPVNDFEGVDELGDLSDYNWGYNPIHFNVPDGSYCTNPKDPYARIIELKRLIKTVQEQGMRVILDVVYNHVYDRETSSFEKIVPGYYFRHDQYGMASNGTGVGNDIASERLMVRKFILDSIQFWIQEYAIDGLRFDLMGILDIETMNLVRNLVDQIDPTVLIIGEGWELNTPLAADQKATIRNQAKLPRIAQFNDVYRDVIKGSTFNMYDKGYVLGNLGKLKLAKKVISGSVNLDSSSHGIFLEPGQTVNYLESHDNHTMWDKFSKIYNGENEPKIRKYQRLATSILLLSQGIPFLHSGQEFYRTKRGIGNSYRSSNDINWLDWERKNTYQEDVEFIKGIIQLRKSHQAFRLRTSDQIRAHFEWLDLEHLLGFRLKDIKSYGNWSELVVILNCFDTKQRVEMKPENQWHILVNDRIAGTSSLGVHPTSEFILEPISLTVLGRIL